MYFSAVRLLHLLARKSRDYGLYCLLYGALNSAQISRVYGLVILLYGAFISCTEFEEGTAELIAVRSANKLHRNRGGVRPGAAVHLHLIFGTENEKGVRLGLLSTFPDFERKFAGGDKLYFSPFSVLYIADKIIKSLLSLTGFPRGGFSRAD